MIDRRTDNDMRMRAERAWHREASQWDYATWKLCDDEAAAKRLFLRGWIAAYHDARATIGSP